MYSICARFPCDSNPTTPTTTPGRQPPRSPAAKRASLIEDIESDEETLVEEFGVEGAAAEEVLGYDPDNDEEDEDGEELEDDNDELKDDDEEFDEDANTAFEELRKRVRVEATQHAEANRRAGGIKTQRAMVRAWEVCFVLQTLGLDVRKLMIKHLGIR
jgi:hypothetical protein